MLLICVTPAVKSLFYRLDCASALCSVTHQKKNIFVLINPVKYIMQLIFKILLHTTFSFYSSSSYFRFF